MCQNGGVLDEQQVCRCGPQYTGRFCEVQIQGKFNGTGNTCILSRAATKGDPVNGGLRTYGVLKVVFPQCKYGMSIYEWGRGQNLCMRAIIFILSKRRVELFIW